MAVRLVSDALYSVCPNRQSRGQWISNALQRQKRRIEMAALSVGSLVLPEDREHLTCASVARNG